MSDRRFNQWTRPLCWPQSTAEKKISSWNFKKKLIHIQDFIGRVRRPRQESRLDFCQDGPPGSVRTDRFSSAKGRYPFREESLSGVQFVRRRKTVHSGDVFLYSFLELKFR